MHFTPSRSKVSPAPPTPCPDTAGVPLRHALPHPVPPRPLNCPLPWPPGTPPGPCPQPPTDARLCGGLGGCLHSTARPCHGSPDIPSSHSKGQMPVDSPHSVFSTENGCLILTLQMMNTVYVL